MPKEKGPEWNYATVHADGDVYFSLQTFTVFFRINVFINVYYNFFDVYHIYGSGYYHDHHQWTATLMVHAPSTHGNTR